MKSIICADDELTIQRILQRILEQRGYDVRLCSNGQEVLEAFDEKPADLVMLDVSMPIMNGIDVCKELRKRPDSYNVPILMVSGIGSEDTITKGLSNGADDYILKPFQSEEILAKVAMALRKRETQTTDDLGIAIGTRFVGRFDIEKRVSSGGFSTIFLAHDVSADVPLEVALKIFDLPISKRSDSRFISLFLREAYQLSKLDHPNIVKLHEFGQTGHFYFLALEFLRGEAIDKRVTRDGFMPAAEVIKVGYETALALQYLHQHHMVHRDVKPANIFLTQDGTTKLVDFGLAKQQDEATLSLSDEFRGTPAFVSPEYILGNQVVDIRSDVYSLGVTLYYAMTSVILFAGNNAMEILNKHFQVIPPPLQQFDPTVPEAFSTLVESMLAKERDQRPDIDQVVDTFATIIEEEKNRENAPKKLQLKLKTRTPEGASQPNVSSSGLFRLVKRQSTSQINQDNDPKYDLHTEQTPRPAITNSDTPKVPEAKPVGKEPEEDSGFRIKVAKPASPGGLKIKTPPPDNAPLPQAPQPPELDDGSKGAGTFKLKTTEKAPDKEDT